VKILLAYPTTISSTNMLRADIKRSSCPPKSAYT
jgi:hypothetical protein